MVQTTEEAFFICFFSSNSRDGNAVAMGLQQDQVFRVLVFTAEVQPGLAQQGDNCREAFQGKISEVSDVYLIPFVFDQLLQTIHYKEIPILVYVAEIPSLEPSIRCQC